MADIFLSYAREDWERIRPLALTLEALGWSLWWDTRMRAGLHFDVMIEREIAAARCVIVLWTEASIKSQWVRAEAAEALDQHKLIPVYLESVRAPLLFRHVQGLKLPVWDGSADDPAFQRLIEDVSELAGPPDRTVPESKPPMPGVEERLSLPDAARPLGASPQIQRVPEPEIIRIQPGVLLMGSPKGVGDDDEHPEHQVHIGRPFGIGRYAVTFEEYDTFANATQRELPADMGWGRGRRPVIAVSWGDAAAYAQWLNERTGKRYRLPTEAEWELAARAGTTGPWSFGANQADLDKVAWYIGNSGAMSHPVAEKEPNPWGLYDVHGNVWEWVQDCWHNDYRGAPTDGSAWDQAGGGDCTRHVVRGGSWFDDPRSLRSAARSGASADFRTAYLGFRLAQDL